MDVGYNNVANAIVNSAQEGFMFNDGSALAKLFVFDKQTLYMLGAKLSNISDFDAYTVLISDVVFAQFTSTYLSYVRDIQSMDEEERHKRLCRLADVFSALMAASQGPWMIPVMRPLALALCSSAQTAFNATQDTGAFAQAASVLLRLLVDLLNDSSTPLEESKRIGSIFVAGLLLRISLRMNAAPGAYAGKALEVRSLSSSGVFSQRDMVSYNYWLGRYYLTCYYIDKARTHLEYAFSNCPAWYYHNKRAILRHLFVANLIRGLLPTEQLLEQYEMEPVYGQLILHFSKGNIAGFQQTLVDNVDFFRSQGNYLILMERTEIQMYRNLLRRVSLINAGSERSRMIPYSDILTAFRVSSQNYAMDDAEMESVLASLLSQKFVLGYAFHHQRILNLSKKSSPFPPIASVV
ncbi:hypothetical protein GGI15_003554 [Coemansia interrupta]|uniref:PCI domain-containing protein n=1 Tax=Coemansia interrupta TaxID=1126814 RepID=A0A9W8LH92_9FUNG|nr:hypothetical protein GGI15_003554 [Coemansia interrupta]